MDPDLAGEIFGPSTLLVRHSQREEIMGIAGALEGHLTATIHGTEEDLAEYNDEYGKFFPTNKPARTTVEVMLNSPDLLVEITATACIPD